MVESIVARSKGGRGRTKKGRRRVFIDRGSRRCTLGGKKRVTSATGPGHDGPIRALLGLAHSGRYCRASPNGEQLHSRWIVAHVRTLIGCLLSMVKFPS